MIGDVVLPSTTLTDWPRLREEIRARIDASMGAAPAGIASAPAKCEELDRVEKHGLVHLRIRYHVVGDEWNEGICILPAKTPAPAVLCIHGADAKRGKFGVIDPERPNRAYGIELARRGYVTFSIDQFGHGEALGGRPQKEVVAEFFKRYPDWSLDGRRLAEHSRAIDALATLPFVADKNVCATKRFGAIGNSLGGRTVMYLAAFDERVAAAVSSTGISPNATNVFRSCTYQTDLSPAMSRAIVKNGKIPWDYHEMIALVAPRALLALEPWNDTENPDVHPTFECFYRATGVYRLLGCPERLSMLVHGEGHDTPADAREFAYRWLDRFLR